MSYECYLSAEVWAKNSQISKSGNFGKLQNWKTFPYLMNFKISKLFINKFGLTQSQVTLIQIKKFNSEEIFHKKTEGSIFAPPLSCKK